MMRLCAVCVDQITEACLCSDWERPSGGGFYLDALTKCSVRTNNTSCSWCVIGKEK